MFLGQGLGYGLRLVYFILIARLLGVLQYGVVVGAFGLVNLIAPYCRLGTGALLLRYVSADKQRFALFWGNMLTVTLGMSCFLIILLHLLAPKLLSPPSAAVVVLTAVANCIFEQLTIASTTSAYDDLDKAMLTHYGMNVANGIYTMAYRIIEMATVPIASIQLAAEPRLFELAASGVEGPMILGRPLLLRGLLVSVAASAALFLCAPMIPLLGGESFKGSVLALRWLCIIPIFRSIHGITGSVLTCIGMQRRRTFTQFAAVLVNFTLNLWLIPGHGWLGAAWSSLSTDGLLALMNWSALQMTPYTGRHTLAATGQALSDNTSPSRFLSLAKPPASSVPMPRLHELDALRGMQRAWSCSIISEACLTRKRRAGFSGLLSTAARLWFSFSRPAVSCFRLLTGTGAPYPTSNSWFAGYSASMCLCRSLLSHDCHCVAPSLL